MTPTFKLMFKKINIQKSSDIGILLQVGRIIAPIHLLDKLKKMN